MHNIEQSNCSNQHLCRIDVELTLTLYFSLFSGSAASRDIEIRSFFFFTVVVVVVIILFLKKTLFFLPENIRKQLQEIKNGLVF